MVSVEWHAWLRRSKLPHWLVALKDRLDYVRWRRANAAGTTCALQKRYAILGLLRAHRIGLVVETGTFLGDMAAFLAARGYDVITIEIDPRLAALARLPAQSARRGKNAGSLDVRNDEDDGIVGHARIGHATRLQGVEQFLQRGIVRRGAEAACVVDRNHAAGGRACEDQIDLR